MCRTYANRSLWKILPLRGICFIFTVLSCTNSSETSNGNIENINNVQTVLESYENRFPYGGVVGHILYSDGVLDHGAVGESEEGISLMENMQFAVGSISKTFTAVIVHQLIEEGSLDLDNTLFEIIPELANDKIPGEVTVRQLLTHGSGIDHPLPGGDGLFNYVIDNPSVEVSFELYRSFMDNPISLPGELYSYSDANYKVLGMIVERIDDKDFESILSERILTPLNLTKTYIGGKTPRDNSAFSWAGNELLKDLDRTAVESMGKYTGNLWSSPSDIANWFKSIFDESVLSSESIELMTQFFPGERGIDYGAGIFREFRNGKEIYWFSGFTIAYASYCGYFPETGDILVVYQNEFNTENLEGIIDDLVLLID